MGEPKKNKSDETAVNVKADDWLNSLASGDSVDESPESVSDSKLTADDWLESLSSGGGDAVQNDGYLKKKEEAESVELSQESDSGRPSIYIPSPEEILNASEGVDSDKARLEAGYNVIINPKRQELKEKVQSDIPVGKLPLIGEFVTDAVMSSMENTPYAQMAGLNPQHDFESPEEYYDLISKTYQKDVLRHMAEDKGYQRAYEKAFKGWDDFVIQKQKELATSLNDGSATKESVAQIEKEIKENYNQRVVNLGRDPLFFTADFNARQSIKDDYTKYTQTFNKFKSQIEKEELSGWENFKNYYKVAGITMAKWPYQIENMLASSPQAVSQIFDVLDPTKDLADGELHPLVKSIAGAIDVTAPLSEAFLSPEEAMEKRNETILENQKKMDELDKSMPTTVAMLESVENGDAGQFVSAVAGTAMDMMVQMGGAFATRGTTMFAQEGWPLIWEDIEKQAEDRGVSTERIVEENLYKPASKFMTATAISALENLQIKGVQKAFLSKAGIERVIQESKKEAIGIAKKSTPLYHTVIENSAQEVTQGAVSEMQSSVTKGNALTDVIDDVVTYMSSNQAVEEALAGGLIPFIGGSAGKGLKKFNDWNEKKKEVKLTKDVASLLDNISLRYGDPASLNLQDYKDKLGRDKSKKNQDFIKGAEMVDEARTQALTINPDMSSEHLNESISLILKGKKIDERLQVLNRSPKTEVTMSAIERAEKEIESINSDINAVFKKSLESSEIKAEKQSEMEVEKQSEMEVEKQSEMEDAIDVVADIESPNLMGSKAKSKSGIKGVIGVREVFEKDMIVVEDARGEYTVIGEVGKPISEKKYDVNSDRKTGESVSVTFKLQDGRNVTIKSPAFAKYAAQQKERGESIHIPVYEKKQAGIDGSPKKSKETPAQSIFYNGLEWTTPSMSSTSTVKFESDSTGDSVMDTKEKGSVVEESSKSESSQKDSKKTSKKENSGENTKTKDKNIKKIESKIKNEIKNGKWGNDKTGRKTLERLLNINKRTIKKEDKDEYESLLRDMNDKSASVDGAISRAESLLEKTKQKTKNKPLKENQVEVDDDIYTIEEDDGVVKVYNSNGDEVPLPEKIIEKWEDKKNPKRDFKETNKELRDLISIANESSPSKKIDLNSTYKDQILELEEYSNDDFNSLTDREMEDLLNGVSDMLDGNPTSGFYNSVEKLKSNASSNVLERITKDRKMNSNFRDLFGVSFSEGVGDFGFNVMSDVNKAYNWLRNAPLEKLDYIFQGDKKGLPILNKIMEPLFQGASRNQAYMIDWTNNAIDIFNDFDKAFGKESGEMRMLASMYAVEKSHQIDNEKKRDLGLETETSSVEDILDRNRKFVNTNGKSEKRHERRLREMEDAYSKANGDVIAKTEKLLEDLPLKKRNALKSVIRIVEEMADANGRFRKMSDIVAAMTGNRMSFHDFYISNMVEKPFSEDISESLRDDVGFIDEVSSAMKKGRDITESRVKHNHFTDFDIGLSALKAHQKISQTYHLYQPSRVLSNVFDPKKYTGRQARVFADAMRMALGEAMNQAYVRRPRNFLKKIETAGYQAQLTGVARMFNELQSNALYAFIYKSDSFMNGIKVLDDIGERFDFDTKFKIVLNVTHMAGSTQISRLAQKEKGSLYVERGVFDETMASDIMPNVSKLKKIIKKPGEWSALMISTPDNIVALPLWVGEFASQFKKETGKDFDWSEFEQFRLGGSEDYDTRKYFRENKDAIKKSRRVADDALSQGFATMNPLSGIISSKVKYDDNVWQRFDKYMTRFRRHEFFSSVEAIRAMQGTGHLTEKQGVRLLTATIARMMSYQLMYRTSQALMYMAISGALGLVGVDLPEVDEENFDVNKKDMVRSFLTSVLTLGALRRMGNLKGTLLSAAIEAANMNLGKGILYDEEYNPFDYGLSYGAVNWNNVTSEYKSVEHKLMNLLVNMTGAYSPTLKAVLGLGTGLQGMAFDKKKKTINKKRRMAIANAVKLAVYFSAMPPQKDIRYAIDAWTYGGKRKRKGTTVEAIKITPVEKNSVKIKPVKMK